MAFSRRKFLTLAGTSAAGAVLMSPLQALYARAAKGQPVRGGGFGPIREAPPLNITELPPDLRFPHLALPQGFQYTAFSVRGTPMSDGGLVPGDHDGMAAFAGPRNTTVLVRNHELSPDEREFAVNVPNRFRYDPLAAGGTTTLIVGPNRRLVRDFPSLAGTYRNCAGGPTPWGTWISCEENTSTPAENQLIDDPQNAGNRIPDPNNVSKSHGFNFEVNPRAGLVVPEPLVAMGRFNHEAICVDPDTGIVYQTEDRNDSNFYRFRPNQPGKANQPANLRAGGVLEALRIKGMPRVETRAGFPIGKPMPVEWVRIEDVNPAEDTVRLEGLSKGAAVFTRGEGIAFGNGEVYFCCTDGGERELGQVWRYNPTAETIELFVEPNDPELLDGPDNVVVTPFGDLIVCEDGDGTQFLVGITQQGQLYDFARNLINDREFAGACFSPDGQTLFVNIQDPGITYAIWGPFPRA
ncbi:MAG: alkaline phosphatase PhoX [Cyanophyceae cyanobacterium]